MADAVVTDSAKTVVFDDRGGYKNYGPSWAAEPAFGQTILSNHIGDQASHILNALRTGAVQTSGEHSNLLIGQGSVRSDIRDASAGVSRDIAANARELLSGQGAIRSESHSMGHMLDKSICEVRDAVRHEGGEGRLKTVEATNALQHAVERQHADAMALLTRGFCDVSKDVLQSKSELQLQAAHISADTRQQMADMKQALERCCCEVKELVRSEAGSTRELFRDHEAQRLRDELNAARSQNTLLQIGIGGPGNSSR